MRIRVLVRITCTGEVLFKNRCATKILERIAKEPFMIWFIRYPNKNGKNRASGINKNVSITAELVGCIDELINSRDKYI